jgi:hypothetical protein
MQTEREKPLPPHGYETDRAFVPANLSTASSSSDSIDATGMPKGLLASRSSSQLRCSTGRIQMLDNSASSSSTPAPQKPAKASTIDDSDDDSLEAEYTRNPFDEKD